MHDILEKIVNHSVMRIHKMLISCVQLTMVHVCMCLVKLILIN